MLATRTLNSVRTQAQPLPDRGISQELLQRSVAFTRRRIGAGHALYRAGQALRAVYFVNAGCIKSVLASSDGRERVTGFHLRGELLALESIGAGAYEGDALALEDSEVWEIAMSDLMSAAARNPELQTAMTLQLSAQVRAERQWLLSVGTLGAEQRVATLLLDLGRRLQALGFSATHFVLRMTRAEIGSFLNLQLETVTRAITHLRERGLLDVTRREIRILDTQALSTLATSGATTN